MVNNLIVNRFYEEEGLLKGTFKHVITGKKEFKKHLD